MEALFGLLVGGFFILAALFIYFLPTIIASGKNSTATFLIFLVNLFGGWTIALGIFVLIWAYASNTKTK